MTGLYRQNGSADLVMTEPPRVGTAPDLARLELLVPGIAHTGRRDLQRYSLAYVERYEGDVLALGHEWEFLHAALLAAWRGGDDVVVVRLVTALAHPAGRLRNRAQAEQILHLGIAAGRRTGDAEHLARFLNRLGGLLFARGAFERGRRIWHESVDLAGASGRAPILWEPFSSFAHIADILSDYATTCQFVETLQHPRRSEDADSLVVALFIRAFYARLAGDLESAHDDLRCCLGLLVPPTPGTAPSSYRQLFSMAVHAELARVQGQYARAQECTETVATLAHLFGDRHTMLELLVDQALFADEHEQLLHTQATVRRLGDIARQSDDPLITQRYRQLEHRLAPRGPAGRPGPDPPAGAGAVPRCPEPLSDREVEVLRLVAAGLANQEIARQLVITPGTVKKHLEHIYGKLDAHSRTAAVARARALQICS